MVYKFPSKGWIESYRDSLKSEKSKTWQKTAKTWEGDFLFVIEPDGKLKKGHTFYIDLWHGECRKVDSSEDGKKLLESEFEYRGITQDSLLINLDYFG